MPARRLSARKIKEVLRLKSEAGRGFHPEPPVVSALPRAEIYGQGELGASSFLRKRPVFF
jgi:hypothetical protein